MDEDKNDFLDIDASDIDIPGIDAELGSDLYDGEMDIYISALRSFAAHIPVLLPSKQLPPVWPGSGLHIAYASPRFLADRLSTGSPQTGRSIALASPPGKLRPARLPRIRGQSYALLPLLVTAYTLSNAPFEARLTTAALITHNSALDTLALPDANILIISTTTATI